MTPKVYVTSTIELLILGFKLRGTPYQVLNDDTKSTVIVNGEISAITYSYDSHPDSIFIEDTVTPNKIWKLNEGSMKEEFFSRIAN